MGKFHVQKPSDFNPDWLANVHVNLLATERQALQLSASTRNDPPERQRLHWALEVLPLIDLTTLAGDDTRSNVQRLCQQAAHPLGHFDLPAPPTTVAALPSTAAVCVYPSRVADAHHMLDRMGCLERIAIAAVATGFPSGQYALASRLDEIRSAIDAGAREIDIVLDRSLVLTGRWKELHAELVAMRLTCGQRARLKAILAVGECGTLDNVFRATLVALMAGADFVKTSTGKEAVNATLPVGLVMIRAMQEFLRRSGDAQQIVGLKAAGGVRTLDEAIAWLRLVRNTLGPHYVDAERFRFGASALLDNVVGAIVEELKGGSQLPSKPEVGGGETY